MNFTDTFGWYYISPDDRAPAWTGVEFLYNFLTRNADVGPFGREAELSELETGDVVQLRREDGDYYHTLIVTGRDDTELLLAAQSNDAFNRPLSTYDFAGARGIHIEGYRVEGELCDCFNDLFTGRELVVCSKS